jgi:transposase
MIELKKLNVHRIVEAKEEALRLISDGFEVIKDDLNILEMKLEKAGVLPIDYNSMTLDQLKTMCKEKNLEGYTGLNKDDLIKFVRENIK